MTEETKRCPLCGEEILAVAKKCKHCGSDLSVVADAQAAVATPIRVPDYGLFLLTIPLVATLLLWFWVGSMTLLQSPASWVALITIAAIVGTALIAAVEAGKVGMVTDRKKGTYSPTAWFLIIALLWIVGYPAYLFKRRHYGLTNRLGVGIVVVIVFVGSAFIMNSAVEQKKAEVLGGLAQLQAAVTGQPVGDAEIKSRVREALSAASSTTTAIEVMVENGGYKVGDEGNLPTNPAELALESPDHYSTKYVKSVSYDAKGNVTVALQISPELGGASGKNIILVPKSDGGEWKWGIGAESTVPARYLPLP